MMPPPPPRPTAEPITLPTAASATLPHAPLLEHQSMPFSSDARLPGFQPAPRIFSEIFASNPSSRTRKRKSTENGDANAEEADGPFTDADPFPPPDDEQSDGFCDHFQDDDEVSEASLSRAHDVDDDIEEVVVEGARVLSPHPTIPRIRTALCHP